MELLVRASALEQIALELTRCTAELTAARLRFRITATGELPGLGRTASAAYDVAVAADRAAQIVGADLHGLAGAVTRLAAGYPELDASLMRGGAR